MYQHWMLLACYLAVGALTLTLGIEFALKHASRTGDHHLMRVAFDRSNPMRAAMVAIVCTWPIPLLLAVLANQRKQVAFHRLQ